MVVSAAAVPSLVGCPWGGKAAVRASGECSGACMHLRLSALLVLLQPLVCVRYKPTVASANQGFICPNCKQK
jgi:hypothetical protein